MRRRHIGRYGRRNDGPAQTNNFKFYRKIKIAGEFTRRETVTRLTSNDDTETRKMYGLSIAQALVVDALLQYINTSTGSFWRAIRNFELRTQEAAQGVDSRACRFQTDSLSVELRWPSAM